MTLQIRIGNKKAKCEVVGDQAAGVGLPSMNPTFMLAKADPQRTSKRTMCRPCLKCQVIFVDGLMGDN